MSQIEWTGKTWNPVTGCTQVGPGCDNCYALSMSRRLKGMKVEKYRNGFDLTLHDDVLDEPLHWRKPCRVFVNSMADLFHKDVPVEFIERVFDVCRRAPQHQFQILTKRSQRLARLAPDLDWPDNIWMGVSVESQAYVYRIDHLREVPVAVRFVSFEPLLGPISKVNLKGIDWAIVGGESGSGARPSHPDWFRSLRSQCKKSGTAFFFKQYGAYRPATANTKASKVVLVDRKGNIRDKNDKTKRKTDAAMVKVGKKKAGRILDGRTWDEYPKPMSRMASS